MKKLIKLIRILSVVSVFGVNAQMSGANLIGGHFSLIDQTGQVYTDKQLLGKHSLVFFGFTHCPSVCPLGLHRMSSALKAIEHFERYIAPVFISVDPERDTPARMHEYLARFNNHFIGLTGNDEQLEQVRQRYRVFASKSVNKETGEYTYDHSAIIYLMGPTGKYVTHFSDTTKVSEMTRIIKEHINNKS